jgi:cytochrome d ubiquinol oxidase subunit I
VHGLKDWPANERPSPIIVPFFGFRIMVGVALLMLAVVAASLWLRWRGELFHTDWFLWVCTLASPLGFIAVTAGWATTEVGRQPWTVYGLLRTRDSVSPSLTGLDVTISLIGYGLVYLVMFSAGFALMVKLVRAGPGEAAVEPEPIESGRPARPVQALPATQTGRRL